jgi:hypothetical protein
MAEMGVTIVDRVVKDKIGGRIDLDRNVWIIPLHNH